MPKLSQHRKLGKVRGVALVEAAMAMIWFGITYFFILYMFEVMEAAQEARLVAGSQMREELIAKNYGCWEVVGYEYAAEVGNEFALEALFKETKMPLEISKLGYSGACPGLWVSRFDWSDYRQPLTPEGHRLGSW